MKPVIEKSEREKEFLAEIEILQVRSEREKEFLAEIEILQVRR